MNMKELEALQKQAFEAHAAKVAEVHGKSSWDVGMVLLAARKHYPQDLEYGRFYAETFGIDRHQAGRLTRVANAYHDQPHMHKVAYTTLNHLLSLTSAHLDTVLNTQRHFEAIAKEGKKFSRKEVQAHFVALNKAADEAAQAKAQEKAKAKEQAEQERRDRAEAHKEKRGDQYRQQSNQQREQQNDQYQQRKENKERYQRKQEQRREQGNNQHRDYHSGGQHREQGTPRTPSLEAAMRTLGLYPMTAETLSILRRGYGSKLHENKFQGEHERAAAQERLKGINAALDTLEQALPQAKSNAA